MVFSIGSCSEQNEGNLPMYSMYLVLVTYLRKYFPGKVLSMYVCIYVCMYVCMYICVYVYVYVYVHVYVHVYVCMYMCMYIYMCMYVHELMRGYDVCLSSSGALLEIHGSTHTKRRSMNKTNQRNSW